MRADQAAVVAACALVAHGSSLAAERQDAATEARTFLFRYVGLTATSDVAALELYRDDARIRVSAWQGGREVQNGLALGKEWKAQLRAGWFDGTTRLEASRFEDASVSVQGQRLVIRAKRYSQTRCYWDNGYAVAIEPDQNGHDQIVEERLSFQHDAYCARPRTRATATPVTQPVAPVPPIAATVAFPAPNAARTGAQPPNIVPSGQGLPRLPAPAPAPIGAGLARPVDEPGSSQRSPP